MATTAMPPVGLAGAPVMPPFVPPGGSASPMAPVNPPLPSYAMPPTGPQAGVSTGAPIAAPLLPPTAAPAPRAPSASHSAVNRRRPNRAVFVSADTAKTQVHLGADGRLPELHLDEAATKEKKIEDAKTTNPLLLLAALGISLGMSVLLLLVDSDRAVGENRTKADARRTIAEQYTRGQPLEPYQLLLREAQQAHAQGNYELERARYRRVLNMLHAEDKSKFEGLTGVGNATSGPSDRHLEELLSTLLGDE